jgi:hypothetical protein
LHLYLPSQAQSTGVRRFWGLAGFEVARCYTIRRGIVTPERPLKGRQLQHFELLMGPLT